MGASGEWQPVGSTRLLGPEDSPDSLARPHAFLHGIANRISSEVPFHDVLTQVVEFVTSVVECDSCFVYVLEGEELVLRASKNPRPEVVDRLKLKVGQA